MTPEELKAARKDLGLTQGGLARALGLGADGARAVRRWEAGERAISGPVAVAVRLMLQARDRSAEGRAGGSLPPTGSGAR